MSSRIKEPRNKTLDKSANVPTVRSAFLNTRTMKHARHDGETVEVYQARRKMRNQILKNKIRGKF